jgi:hypothetical protein
MTRMHPIVRSVKNDYAMRPDCKEGRMNDVFVGWITGFLCGGLFAAWLASGNPTMTGSWYCSEWQIVHDKPECHVMTIRSKE